MARAVEQLSAAYRSAVQNAARYPDLVPARSYLAALLGVAELRRGELENCIGGHASASCIVPIAKAGLHHAPSGSQNAAKYLTEYLARASGRSGHALAAERRAHDARNLPGRGAAEYRIDPSVFTSSRRSRPLRGRRGGEGAGRHRPRRRRRHRGHRQRRPARRRPLDASIRASRFATTITSATARFAT